MKLFVGVMSVLKAEFAWPGGDVPGDLDFRHQPSVQVIEAIAQALAPSFPPASSTDARYGSLSPPDGPVGRYRLSTREGSWFVRVSSRSGDPELEVSTIDYLFNKGVNVNPFLVVGETLHWDGQIFRIDVRPLIEGRHFNGSTEDMRNLASTLAACHRSLKDFPRACEVRSTAVARNLRLSNARDRIAEALHNGTFEVFAEHAQWASAHRDWLSEMAEQFDPHLDRHPDAQCVHGEVHPANVLFRRDDGAPVLVDFEESVHLFMPHAWDLAFLVQRFCLRDHPLPSTALQRLAAVVDGYGDPLPELAPMMRQAAWFNMTVIVDLRTSQGILTPVSECDKFVRLERQARAYEGLL
ncbi:MAG: phosphotransferase enzyme family protein [Candidatus Methylomirabilales bacterium]